MFNCVLELNLLLISEISYRFLNFWHFLSNFLIYPSIRIFYEVLQYL